MDKEYDAIVLGAGIIGVCSAMSLQKNGQKTVLIDQFNLPHKLGSSGGQARITRLAHLGQPQLGTILEDSLSRWGDLSKQVGEQLISLAPMLVVGGMRDLVTQMGNSLYKAGQRPNWLSIQQTNKKYKTRYPEHYIAFEDLDAGIMRADRCHNAALTLFRKHGGVVKDGFRVDKIDMGNGWVTVNGPMCSIKASKLVICAGPWASQVLKPMGIHLPLQPTNTRAYFFENGDFAHTALYDCTENQYFYGLPAMDSKGLYKIGMHTGDKVEPNGETRDLSYIGDKIKAYAQQWLPILQEAGHEDCWYTETPDKEFILDHHPNYPNIAYAVGFSAAGFKVGPSIGHIIACEVMGKEHGFDLTPFRANRFTNSQSTPIISKI